MKQVKQQLALTAVVVRDYDEAIRSYVDVLGFELVEDSALPEQNFWRDYERFCGNATSTRL